MRLRPLVLLCLLASPANALTFQTRLERVQWQVEGDQLIIGSAIDNLLKGASAQAMQCININYGFEQTCSLI